MVQTGQIIYFSNQKMMCFDVESIEDITEPPEQIETTWRDKNVCAGNNESNNSLRYWKGTCKT